MWSVLVYSAALTTIYLLSKQDHLLQGLFGGVLSPTQDAGRWGQHSGAALAPRMGIL